MTKNKAAIHNLGCKVNSYEAEAAAELLKADGYEIVSFDSKADVYIINTCSVTNIADRKSRQMLHKAKSMNPEAIVVAMGCYVQTGQKQLETDEAVDIIIGNDQKKNICGIIADYKNDKTNREYVEDLTKRRAYEELSVSNPGEHIRGFMKVQDGCDQFCSYCIIPYARGRVRSRSIDDAVKEATSLSKAGCREVVLSGIHLSSYGRDLDEDITLLTLIKEIHKIDGIERIRLGSLEPGIITDEFAKELSSLKKVCPHFHLSLQSGCDKTLKAMNRRYTAAEYKEKCEILRAYYDAPSITTDVITGFPGESEEDFEESYSFVEGISFFETHIFPFSSRKGTRAETMPNQLTEAVKKQRASRLIELNKKTHKMWLEGLIGHELEVLIEEEQIIDGRSFWIGHTARYERVAVLSSENIKNKIVRVKPNTLYKSECLIADII